MAKLHFIYGTMGCSKTAQALIRRFNYIEKGKKVLFLKSSIDNRDGKNIIRSRIGIEAEVLEYGLEDNIIELFMDELKDTDYVIIDEVNFATAAQVEQMRTIADEFDIPVYAYGLKANFQSHLFEGSKRLFEIADVHTALESICHCGKPTIVNARYKNGKIEYEGELIVIGGDEKYINLCYDCWKKGNLGKNN